MSIIYTVIAKENEIILADYTKCTGNFILMANQVLKYCTPSKKYARFQVQAYVFYQIYINDVIYLCMCELEYEQRIAFMYLEDIRKLFETTFNKTVIQNAKLYGLNTFSKILSERAQLFNTPQNVDKTMDQITEISRQNLDKVIARGDKIEVLVEKTRTMAALSLDLKSNSKTLRNQMMWKNLKWYFLAFVVILLVIYFLMVSICGGFALKRCF